MSTFGLPATTTFRVNGKYCSDVKDEVCDSWPTMLQNALLWYDYFSVPQEAANIKNTQSAIRSIPVYVEVSTIPFVLAPTVPHSELVTDGQEPVLCDYFSWQMRGWCRMELIAMLLRGGVRSPVVIRTESYMHFMSAAGLDFRVAEGDFACCTMNHQRIRSDGTVSSLSCDKPPLYDILRVVISRRIRCERDVGNLRGARQLLATAHTLLRDLRDVEDNYQADENTLDAFLEKYSFTTPQEFDGGWTPLRFACISGNVNVARQLIEGKADLEANLEGVSRTNLLSIENGKSILCHIVSLCCCSEHEDILNLLVSHNANLHSAKYMDALSSGSCSRSSSKRGARWFLHAFPKWDVNRRSFAQDGTHVARRPLLATLALTSDLDFVRVLCERNADVALQAWPSSADAFIFVCSICPSSSPELPAYILRRLLQRHDASNTSMSAMVAVNRRIAAPLWIRMLFKVRCALNIGPYTTTRYLLRVVGVTALLLAAHEGKDRVCQWLLDEKADASIANMDGETALGLAQERGFQRVVEVLHAHASASG